MTSSDNNTVVRDGLLLQVISGNLSQLGIGDKSLECHRENSILHIMLMFGTLWLGLFLYNFRKTYVSRPPPTQPSLTDLHLFQPLSDCRQT